MLVNNTEDQLDATKQCIELEHKLAAYRYYIKRMFTLPLNKEHQHKEWTTTLETARSNNRKPPNQVKTTNTTKINPYNTTTHGIQKQHQVDDIHIRIPPKSEKSQTSSSTPR
jgi:hypothetical protein